MIQKTFKDKFYSAYTLNPSYIGKQPSGWEISGEIINDYYEWVNTFMAEHPIYGKVYGDFEDIVFADSNEGFRHFFENHPPCAWDYGDI